MLIKSKPLVSIIVPTYNRSEFISETLISIYHQDYDRIEIIVVDDGSLDDTEEKVTKIAIPNLKYIKTTNRGVSAAFNTGVEVANGDILARSDSDDISLPSRISDQVSFMQSSGCDAIGCGLKLFGSSNQIWRYPRTNEEAIFHAIFAVPLAQPTAIFNAKIFNVVRYNESIRNGEDYEFFTRMLSNHFTISSISKPLVMYRVHDNQLSSSPLQDKILYNACVDYLKNMLHVPTNDAENISGFIHCGSPIDDVVINVINELCGKFSTVGNKYIKKNIFRIVLKRIESLNKQNKLTKYQIKKLNLGFVYDRILKSTVINRFATNNVIKGIGKKLYHII